MKGKLKEVFDGVNMTQALSMQGWKHSHHRAGVDTGGCHFWSLRRNSSSSHPHSAPCHKGHGLPENPFSNHVLHPETKSSHFLSLKVQALAMMVATACADVLPVFACVLWHVCARCVGELLLPPPVAAAH